MSKVDGEKLFGQYSEAEEPKRTLKQRVTGLAGRRPSRPHCSRYRIRRMWICILDINFNLYDWGAGALSTAGQSAGADKEESRV